MYESTRHYLDAPMEVKSAAARLEVEATWLCGVSPDWCACTVAFNYAEHVYDVLDALYCRIFGCQDRSEAVRHLLSDIGILYDWEAHGEVGEEEDPWLLVMDDEGGPYEGWNSFTLEASKDVSDVVDLRRLFGIRKNAKDIGELAEGTGWLVSYHLLEGDRSIRIGVTQAPCEGDWYGGEDAYCEDDCMYVLMHIINHSELHRVSMAVLSKKERGVA